MKTPGSNTSFNPLIVYLMAYVTFEEVVRLLK